MKRMSKWVLLGAMVAGCASAQSNEQLHNGYTALANHDYAQAISAADAIIQANPTAPGAAEAYYLRGRVFEERATNLATAAGDLQQARAAFIQALDLPKSEALEGLIRAGLGDVAFKQDDYATAATQLEAGYDKLQTPQEKARDLYLLGVSRQRLGQWTEADHTFTGVISQYPGSALAKQAQTHLGARQFFVEISPGKVPASEVVSSLQRQGLTASNAGNAVRVGPFANYEQARTAKSRLVPAYPNAAIVP